MPTVRNLVIVLGDQLDLESPALDGFDPALDLIWMAEVAGESTYVLSHRVRIAYFLSCMRHFAAAQQTQERRVEYTYLDDEGNTGDLATELKRAIQKFKPDRLIAVEPGEYRIEQMLLSIPNLEIRPDTHFFCSRGEFAQWAKSHKQLRMEFFYREMRKKSGILMEKAQPLGGRWNFDVENRASFGKSGPPRTLHQPHAFPPDKITREVIELVDKTFPNHPGSLAHFDLPVTAEQAEAALQDFVKHGLPEFGAYQDAMWTDQPFLYHSRLSGPMNLKLLNPRRVLTAVEDAHHRGHAPLAAAEGFIRQILGWREYIRGIYWTQMPAYAEKNALHAAEKLPDFYWTGKTDMECLRQTIGQTLEYGYAHHIQRLMVTGLYSLLFGVDPVEIHQWYLAIYWDAVEWVELPNVIGMSQFADGGFMSTKPYAASGKYISRMSNYCRNCRYNSAESVGENACPFTTLYWDFLLKHEKTLAKNPRMLMQLKNLARLDPATRKLIHAQASQHRTAQPKGGYTKIS
jgi:deoxyribodipyrimidine photolyase-related protein